MPARKLILVGARIVGDRVQARLQLGRHGGGHPPGTDPGIPGTVCHFRGDCRLSAPAHAMQDPDLAMIGTLSGADLVDGSHDHADKLIPPA